jgi:predicted acylesterase/phospholipase RssA
MAAKAEESDSDLGLCLGGGGGLGFLHIGLFEAMEELGIRPGMIAGTSSGAVLGALYSAGRSSAEMTEVLREFRWASMVAPTLPRRGFLSTRRMESFFRKHLGPIDIPDLPIPLKIAAVELNTGELVGFTEGSLARCLAASCTMPGIFEPVKVGGGTYYDAGGIYNLPLELLSGEGLKTIIAGNTIGRNSLLKRPRTVQDVLFQAYLIRTWHLTRWRTEELGWSGRKEERLVLVDYHTRGANPSSLEECKTLIRDARKLSLEVLGEAFRGKEQ